jgi:Tol biopolymer transport system component
MFRRTIWFSFITSFLLFTLTAGNVTTIHAAPNDTIRVSVASDGTEANDHSYSPLSISADGRYVAFGSYATNLVSDDTNNIGDIFIHDTLNGTTTRVSVASDGTEADGYSYSPSISADGRYVAFGSYATNLVSDDTNNIGDIFIHDTLNGTTTRVSVASDGTEADGYSYSPSISADGRYVAFVSRATNLVSDDTNNIDDIFIHDTLSGTTTRVSIASDGTEANGFSNSPSISANGRYVAFESYATNLVANDQNNASDIFVHDILNGTTTRVSISWIGREADGHSYHPSISADGRYVAFESDADNLPTADSNWIRDIFVRDTVNQTTIMVSVASDGTQANDYSRFPFISADGRYVAFESDANNLVSNDINESTDIFIHNIEAGITTRVSVASDGTEANFSSYPGPLSANGHYVVFQSGATNLVSGDTNDKSDIFLHKNPMANAFCSSGAYDGWVLESSETSNQGGSLNRNGTWLYIGDDAANRQYRAILSFNTASLPDEAEITNVTLKIWRSTKVGTDPFITHGKLLIDVRKGAFSNNPALQLIDFQAPASQRATGYIIKSPRAFWYQAVWTSDISTYINKTGITQFRLRFYKDDNNDNGADYIKVVSGNDNALGGSCPTLTVEYRLP